MSQTIFTQYGEYPYKSRNISFLVLLNVFSHSFKTYTEGISFNHSLIEVNNFSSESKSDFCLIKIRLGLPSSHKLFSINLFFIFSESCPVKINVGTKILLMIPSINLLRCSSVSSCNVSGITSLSSLKSG